MVMCQSSFQTIMLDLKRLIHLAKIQSVYMIGKKTYLPQTKCFGVEKNSQEECKLSICQRCSHRTFPR